MTFTFSRGRNTFDNRPQQRSAPDLHAFAKALLSDRQVAKGQGYVCSALNSDGRRCKEGALDRRWLPIDCDGVDPAVHPEFRLWLGRFRGFGWATASSTPEAPRERIIVVLSREVTRDEGISIGRLLIADLGDEFGTGVTIDPCTFRAEQPCYLPVGDVTPFYFTGEPIDADVWLERAPPVVENGAPDDTGAEDWITLLTEGEDVHQGALRLVARMVAKGLVDSEIRAYFTGVAGTVAKARGQERATELLGRELDRMIEGARVKGFAPDREARDADDAPADDEPTGAFVGPHRAAVGLDALEGEPYQAPDVVAGLYPRDAGAMVAPGETGKTTVALYEAAHIVLSRPLYGHRIVQPGAVLIVTAEDDRATLAGRLNSIAVALGVTDTERAMIAAGVFIEDISERPIRLMQNIEGRAERTVFVEELIEAYRGAGLAMVHLDPLSLIGPGEDLGNDGMSEMMRTLRHLSRQLQCAVRVAHHVSKEVARNGILDQYTGRGASAIADNARFNVQMSRTYERTIKTPTGTWRVPSEISAPDLKEHGVLLLIAHKHSYRAKRQAPIVFTREGFKFIWRDAVRDDGSASPEEGAAQLERDCTAVREFIITREADVPPSRYSRRRLDDAVGRIIGKLTRARLRDAVSELIAGRRLFELELPKAEQRGQFKTYLSTRPGDLLGDAP